MSAINHHEDHPDAEMLSAFAELALNSRERGDVLRHLAVCGRCREIVALAREAATTEASAARHGVVRTRVWWRGWGFVLAPAAAVAATAVIAFYVHERSLEKSAEFARLERQQAVAKAPMPSQAPPPKPQARVDAPAPAPNSSPSKAKKTTRPDSSERPASVAEPEETVSAPPPEIMNRLLPSHDEPAQTPRSERHAVADDALPPAATPPNGAVPSEAAVVDEERQQQAHKETEERREFAARAPMSSDKNSPQSASAEIDAGAKNQPADVSAQQNELQPPRAAGYLRLHGMRSLADLAAGSYAIHLPGGRPAVSIASADHRTLAIDDAGALFVREDSEGTWNKVKRQWTGHATIVRRQAPESRTPAASPAPATPGSSAVSHPATVFELVNDQSQVWISLDGRIWTAQ